MKIKHKKYNTIRRKNQKAMWKLLLAVTLGSITAIIFPFALDVMQPTAHFPQAHVIKEVVKAEVVNITVDKSETVEQTIRRIAKEENFPWVEYLIRLAKCENDTLDPNRTNTRGNHPAWSVDRGIFMINNFHHAEVSDEQAFNVEFATKWTIKRILQGYQSEWVCDKYVRANPNKYNP